MATCSKCGYNQIPDGGLHCPQCGSTLDQPIPGAAPTAPHSVGEIPWKQRDTLGFVEAFKNTIIEIFTKPVEFYQKIRKDDDWLSPILFIAIVAWIAGFFEMIYSFMFQGMMAKFIPQLGQYGAMSGFMSGAVFSVIGFILAPLIYLIIIIIWSALVHLAAMVFGDGQNGFEITFKAVAYSFSTSLLKVIPICGGLVGGIWGLVLVIIGLKEGHKTETWKAVMAPLIWLILCCLCGILGSILFGTMLSGMMSGMNQ